MKRFRRGLVGLGLMIALVLGLSVEVGRAATDWSQFADEETVMVATSKEDGSQRDTKVWLIVVDGQGYIRTGGTRWGGDVERDPAVTLRIGEVELPLTVEFVTDDEARQKIVDAFREKYGFTDRMLSVFRGSTPKIMKLLPRGEEAGESAP